MATPIERVIEFASAILGTTATELQLRAVAHAYAMRADEHEIVTAFGVGRDELNDEQKCIVLLEMVRREIRGHLRYTAEQAALTEAQPGIKAAGDSAANSF